MVLFKNITNDRIEAYGYTWLPEGAIKDSQEVNEPSLISKFRKYTSLKAVEILHEEPKRASNIEFETMKSQAIAQGMKVDGRWNSARLEREVKTYMREANGD